MWLKMCVNESIFHHIDTVKKKKKKKKNRLHFSNRLSTSTDVNVVTVLHRHRHGGKLLLHPPHSLLVSLFPHFSIHGLLLRLPCDLYRSSNLFTVGFHTITSWG